MAMEAGHEIGSGYRCSIKLGEVDDDCSGFIARHAEAACVALFTTPAAERASRARHRSIKMQQVQAFSAQQSTLRARLGQLSYSARDRRLGLGGGRASMRPMRPHTHSSIIDSIAEAGSRSLAQFMIANSSTWWEQVTVR
jgi:hypothetical protein